MSRLQEIEFLRVKGGIFAEDVDLPLFKKSKQIPIFTLLYGKNGTGKSTISRAISKISGKEEKQIVKAEFLAEDGSVLTIDDSIKEVFDIWLRREDLFTEEEIMEALDEIDMEKHITKVRKLVNKTKR